VCCCTGFPALPTNVRRDINYLPVKNSLAYIHDFNKIVNNIKESLFMLKSVIPKRNKTAEHETDSVPSFISVVKISDGSFS